MNTRTGELLHQARRDAAALSEMLDVAEEICNMKPQTMQALLEQALVKLEAVRTAMQASRDGLM